MRSVWAFTMASRRRAIAKYKYLYINMYVRNVEEYPVKDNQIVFAKKQIAKITLFLRAMR